MFKKTRKHLTLMYGGIIGLILLIMACTFYIVLSGVLHTNENERISDTARKTILQWNMHVHPHDDGRFDKVDKGLEWEFIQTNQFALVADKKGKILSHSIEGNSPQFLQAAQMNLKKGGGRLTRTVQYTDDGKMKEYLVSVFPLPDSSQNLLYIGEEISGDLKLLHQMRLYLGILSFILLIVASGIGYIFAGRAMVPITKAFKKQQEFTANASHELRTPLSILHSAVEILEEQNHQLPEVHQTVLGSMKDEIRRMILLVQNLLALARNDDNPLDFKREPFDLKGAVYSVVDRMQNVALEKSVELKVLDPHPGEDVWFVGDADQMYQLIYILADNAIKYSFTPGTITIQCSKIPSGRLEILISDEGCGIPAEDLPHIFERFYRVDKARSRDSGGSGLGLAIAASIVQTHGGTISVTSVINEGSTFQVLLPKIN